MFSNYSTIGGSVGFWSQLPLEFELSGQFGLYQTSYAKENAPVPAGLPVPSDRSDTLKTFGLDLSYPLIKNRWNLDFSETFSNNDSSGQQGIPGASSVTTYTYTRNYALITTTVNF